MEAWSLSLLTSESAGLSSLQAAARLPEASIGQMSQQLLSGYWSWAGGQSQRSFNMSDTGSGAKNGVLHYNYSGSSGADGNSDTNGISTAHRELVDQAFDYLGAVLGIDFQMTTETSTDIVDFYFSR